MGDEDPTGEDRPLSALASVAGEVEGPLLTARTNLEVVAEDLARIRACADASITPYLDDADARLDAVRTAIDHVGILVRRLVAAVPPAPPPSDATPPPAATKRWRRGRVLVVDDDESVLRALERILRVHDVVALRESREALERITHGERFDVILCDLVMPLLDGPTVHAAVDRVDREQAARMIFITGGAPTDRARRFLADPTRRVVTKPFDSAALRALVEDLLVATRPSGGLPER
jgi:CheY-like chemotaxis protein